jgi:hypothetical protein
LELLLPGDASRRSIYIFQVREGKLSGAVGVEDNLSRMRQLGIGTKDVEA